MQFFFTERTFSANFFLLNELLMRNFFTGRTLDAIFLLIAHLMRNGY